MTDALDPRAWLAGYRKAWVELDAEAAAALFTEDAVYRSHPIGSPHLGREGVGRYWRDVTATQEGVELVYGEPLVIGRNVAVEWWATFRSSGEPVTIPGSFFLRFDERGLCRELREYWNFTEGTHAPPDGWGLWERP